MKTRHFIRTLLIVLILSFVVSISIVQAQAGLTTTTNQRVNLRTAPAEDATLVQLIRGGTAISLDGRNASGGWVRGITSDGLIGWLVSGAVNITLSDLNGLPLVTENTPFNLPAPAPNVSGPQFAEAGNANDTIVTASANVNVRSGPGRSYRRIDGLQAGESINVDGHNFAGTWVRGITARGNVGWVSATYLNISQAQIEALPLVDIDTPFSLTAPAGGASVPSAGFDVIPVANNAPVTGFGYGGHVAGFGEPAAQWMRVAGMTWVKRQVRYFDGANPNDFAGMINETHARGFRILLGVVGATPNDINNPGYFDRYAGFMAGLAGLGADALEVWNEPNLDREWAAPIDPARYTDLLRASYNAIKSANPNTLVISGAPAPTGAEAAYPGRVMNDDRFLAGMAAAGAVNYMDCIGAHYNEGIVPPNWTSGDPRSEYYTRYLPSMMNVYFNAFGGNRPVCFTELGYLTSEGYGPLPSFFAWAENVTVAQQAAWLDQAVSITRNSGRVRLLIVWNIDFTNYGEDPMGGFAMIRPGGGCPACEALGR